MVPLIDYARKIGLNVGSFSWLDSQARQLLRSRRLFNSHIKQSWIGLNSIYVSSPHFGTELRRIVQENGWLSEHTNSQLGTGLINTPDFDAVAHK